MRILLLGGPKFVGRHTIDAALARGHEVTLFNRGTTNADAYPDLERITGDRDGGLDALAGRRWDAVIDTCGYVPRLVRDSAKALAQTVDRYLFVSTISVYGDFAPPGLTEDAPVGTLEDPNVEEITGDTYGPLKALCETAVNEVYGDRALIVRPGLIVGPHDPTNRYTYWVERCARGGDVLCPRPADSPVQVVDGRDLAEWMIRLLENNTAGTLHVSGPAKPVTFGDVVDLCVTAGGADAKPIWVDESFLLEKKVGPWMELPLWLPGEEMDGLSRIDLTRALAAGLTLRPLADTIADTLAWVGELPADRERKAGLDPDKERELLAAWRLSD